MCKISIRQTKFERLDIYLAKSGISKFGSSNLEIQDLAGHSNLEIQYF